jgi:hypothetical protein
LNNPVKYNDPTGHIASDEYLGAMEIIDQLWNDFGITIEVDFGWQPLPHPEPGGPGQIWVEGNWQLGDLEAVHTAVKDFASAAGGADAARQALGGLTIKRTHGGVTGHLRGSITLSDYVFDQGGFRDTLGTRIAIVHELAHYWDWHTGNLWTRTNNQPGAIVRSMSNAIQNEPGPTWWARTSGIGEDWAESVAMYVYQDYANILRAENDLRETGRIQPGLGLLHRQFVASQFAALSVANVYNTP